MHGTGEIIQNGEPSKRVIKIQLGQICFKDNEMQSNCSATLGMLKHERILNEVGV